MPEVEHHRDRQGELAGLQVSEYRL